MTAPSSRRQDVGAGESAGASAHAPCCWRQNLEDHDSDIARQLRDEIHARLAAGDTPDAIEADLARRYGDDIVVHERGWAIGGAALAALGAGLFVAVTWFRRRRRAPEQVVLTPEDPDDADRLDDELAALGGLD